ncbi:DUF5682 family protein [Arthrobacter sp. ISL-72]|uniref:DUF5682 family protein n=1 Tax=Arthrobacter sp. ISL-72 TaxID=2819114 RepID=UPI001BE64020|nr:DUF5682 family protein [Arthrobacter sp. ISL-72]MBT2597106.1 hypothetical protein [Arthrobacter sp. ISL-72]
MTDVHVLGIRHHGPGSARSVAEALSTLRPDLVLIEGPPELDQVVPLLSDPAMVPPVAGLIYVSDQPRLASFYPLADFSPEWVAFRWAASTGTPARTIDLAAGHSFALDLAAAAEPAASPQQPYRPDAIAMMAQAAGYGDAERWWEDAVEHRTADPLERFAAITEAIAEIRAVDDRPADHPDVVENNRPADHPDVVENNRREAGMRRLLRAAMREGHARIAVVCGAYHAPALVPAHFPPASADNKVLAGLPRTKVAVTWVPWTSDRLRLQTGYGAGVAAPGWYQHLFAHWTAPDSTADVATTWLVRVAQTLRREKLDASTASVVEASRMANALAAVRGRPSPGLAELDDAAQAVLCDGSALPLALVHRELAVGHGLGSVPESTPSVPLAADLAATQRRLRLQPSALEEFLTIDLRKPAQLARSVLLHRLALLGVNWGTPADTGRTTGTFKEVWTLLWQPELTVAVVDASRYGTTLAAAAAACVAERARVAGSLADLSELLASCLLADLPDGISAVVAVLAERTALQQDVGPLLETIAPLARTLRYGNVRGVDVTGVQRILDATLIRACVGLPVACAGLDDAAATAMRRAVDSAQYGLSLLSELTLDDWHRALAAVAGSDRIHGSIAGRATRLLLDAGLVERDEVAARLSRRLSVATPAPEAAAWLDGLLSGDAVLLIHDRHILQIVDDWLTGVRDEVFDDVLPLLRRTFSAFSRPERREIGEQVSRGPGPAQGPGEATLDLQGAGPAVRRMAGYLGWEAIA